MQIKFTPLYSLTPKIANTLGRIEAVKAHIKHLPLTPKVLASLRETARLHTTHYSTMIEGNQLDPSQIQAVLKHEEHFPGRERDENEIKGYYAALHQIELWVSQNTFLTESIIQKLHALVMSNGRTHIKASAYRDGQNVIRDGRTKTIVYMPPEAKDVSPLMNGMMQWIKESTDIPYPIIAGIAHYQLATIHPYYDGNGRTARLLTTFLLHQGGYDLKGLYSLEEYYAKNLGAYYEAITVGPSHNYYLGRAESDITKWIEYFLEGMAFAFENVLKRMEEANLRGEEDTSALLRKLDPKQRKILELFQLYEIVTSKQVGMLFGFKPRTSAYLCKQWTDEGFLEVANTSNKRRAYRLGQIYLTLLETHI
jgi:Fic family protein